MPFDEKLQIIGKGEQCQGLLVCTVKYRRFDQSNLDSTSAVAGKADTSQLSETMIAKYYGHKNVITKSKQKDWAYFWTIPFFVK